MMGLDRRKLDEFLLKYYAPSFQTGSLGDPLIVGGSKEERKVTVERKFSDDSGDINLDCEVEETAEGIKAPWYVTDMILTAGAKRFRLLGTGHGIDKVRIWAEQAEKDGPMLAAMGIPGIVRGGKGPLIPWTEWGQFCRERIVAYKARHPAPYVRSQGR